MFQKIYRFSPFKLANLVSLSPIVDKLVKCGLQTTVVHPRLLYENSFINYNQTIYYSVHNCMCCSACLHEITFPINCLQNIL